MQNCAIPKPMAACLPGAQGISQSPLCWYIVLCIFLFRLLCTDLPMVLVFGIVPLIACYFLHLSYGDRLLLVLAGICVHLQLDVLRASHSYNRRHPSLLTTQQTSVVTYAIHVLLPFAASTLHGLPTQTQCVCASVYIHRLLSLLAPLVLVLATILLPSQAHVHCNEKHLNDLGHFCKRHANAF